MVDQRLIQKNWTARERMVESSDAHSKALDLAAHLECSDRTLEQLVSKQTFLRERLRCAQCELGKMCGQEREYTKYFLFFKWRDIWLLQRNGKRRAQLQFDRQRTAGVGVRGRRAELESQLGKEEGRTAENLQTLVGLYTAIGDTQKIRICKGRWAALGGDQSPKGDKSPSSDCGLRAEARALQREEELLRQKLTRLHLWIHQLGRATEHVCRTELEDDAEKMSQPAAAAAGGGGAAVSALSFRDLCQMKAGLTRLVAKVDALNRDRHPADHSAQDESSSEEWEDSPHPVDLSALFEITPPDENPPSYDPEWATSFSEKQSTTAGH